MSRRTSATPTTWTRSSPGRPGPPRLWTGGRRETAGRLPMPRPRRASGAAGRRSARCTSSRRGSPSGGSTRSGGRWTRVTPTGTRAARRGAASGRGGWRLRPRDRVRPGVQAAVPESGCPRSIRSRSRRRGPRTCTPPTRPAWRSTSGCLEQHSDETRDQAAALLEASAWRGGCGEEARSCAPPTCTTPARRTGSGRTRCAP